MAETPTQSQLGRYRLVRVLGRGAMGVVYEALDPKLGRQVAIKTILKGHLLDDTVASDYSERFVREARAVARLSHPNIVTVYDFGEQDEAAYLVMEFIHGGDLGAALAAGERFELGRAVDLMCELLGALAYAHVNGVVHRDVKPANVMIDHGGHVKLTDFGVARLSDSNAERTVPGTMVGTPSYMAPEQIQGLAVGSRADTFAAGVILYQLLTGRRPFVGDGGWAIQKQIVQEQPPLPSSLNPALPPVFDAIVMQSLAKDPAQRHETADVFAAELRQALASAALRTPAVVDADATVIRPPAAAAPSPTLPPGPAVPVPAIATGGGAARRLWPLPLALALLVAGAGAVMLLRQPGSGEPAAPPVLAEPSPAPSPAPAPAFAAPAPAAQPAAPPVHDAPILDPVPTPAATVTASEPALRPPPSRPGSAPGSEAGANQSASYRAAAIRAAASRCADLVQRTQLGDTLSPREQEILQKECRR